MAKDPVAVRYAEALFEVGKREGRLTELAQELEELAALIRQHDALRELLLNPDVEIPDKLRVLGRLMGEAWSEPLPSFVRLALTMERPAQLVEMAEAMRRLVDDEQRVRRVTVRTARALAPALRDRLVKWLSQREQATVTLVEEVDAGLLGGIQVTIGHRTFDGSVRAQLQRLHQRLRSVRVH